MIIATNQNQITIFLGILKMKMNSKKSNKHRQQR